MTTRADHIRPSALPSLELCPGAALMQARALALIPALGRIVHAAAEQGTLGHAVVAQTLALIYHGPDGWSDPVSVLTKAERMMAGLSDWTRDAVRRCVSYAVALIDGEHKRTGIRPTVEVEMHLSGKCIDIARGGTADLVILGSGRVIVADWKLGFLDQGEAADHLQLAAYAVMAWEKYISPRYRQFLLEPFVEVHLAQGRRREFSAATFDKNAIDAVRERIRSVVAGAMAEKPPLRPSIDACRYCKALTHCRAARERIMNANDEIALFGDAVADRIKLAEDAAIAKRFAEEVKALQNQWVSEAQAVGA
jgi:hypothetical protein